MRIENRGLKMEKGLKERSGRYALYPLPFCVSVNRRKSAVKALLGGLTGKIC